MFDREQEEEQLSLPLPDGVLTQNIRVPLLVCVNKSDLQSQVLREESTSKILVILYHLRSLCIKCNNKSKYRWRFVDLYLDKEQLQHKRAVLVHHSSHLLVPFQVPLRTTQLRSHIHPAWLRQTITRQVYPTLPSDSVVKIDVSKSYNDVIPQPTLKKNVKEEIIV